MSDELLITKREILAILFHRKWTMLLVFASSVGIAAFFAYYLISPTYEAEAKIIINSSYLTEPLRDAPPESEFEKLAGFHTQREILESERIAAEAARRTKLAERRVISRIEQLQIFVGDVKRFVGRLLDIERWKKPWSAEAAAIGEVDEWLRVAALPDSKALRITYRAKDPQEAADVLNAVIDAHVEYYYGVYRKRAEGIVNFLEQDFARASEEVRTAENALLRMRKSDRLAPARSGAAREAAEGIVGITDSTKLQDEVKLYVLKLEEELRIAGEIPDHGRRERMRADISARLKVYQDALNSVPSRELDLVRLRRIYDSANDNFQILQRNLTRARLVAGGETDKIRLIEIFERAKASDDPISPKKQLILSLAALMGAVLALTWAFVAHYLDHSVRAAHDVERYLGLKLLCSIRKMA